MLTYSQPSAANRLMGRVLRGTVGERMLDPSRSNFSTPIVLVSLMLISLLVGFAPPPSELQDAHSRGEVSGTVSYDLYFATAPGGHPHDGRVTTERPDSGGQEEQSISGDTVEFSTDKMLSDIVIHGKPTGSKYELDVTLWLKSQGPEGSTVD